MLAAGVSISIFPKALQGQHQEQQQMHCTRIPIFPFSTNLLTLPHLLTYLPILHILEMHENTLFTNFLFSLETLAWMGGPFITSLESDGWLMLSFPCDA